MINLITGLLFIILFLTILGILGFLSTKLFYKNIPIVFENNYTNTIICFIDRGFAVFIIILFGIVVGFILYFIGVAINKFILSL
jgi:hypothetical protein